MSDTCEAYFEADSDIDGVGVMVAFLFNAWLTVVVSAVAHLDEILALFQTTLDQLGVPSQKETLQPPRKIMGLARALLSPLCDLQAVTGAAIIIAGLAQKDTITLFHRQLVVLYFLLTLGSFWAARPGIMDIAGSTDKVVAVSRQGMILLSTWLGAIFQTLTILAMREWDDGVEGQCFRFWDRLWLTTEAVDWFFAFWTYLYAVLLTIVIIGRLDVINYIYDALQAPDLWLRRKTQETYYYYRLSPGFRKALQLRASRKDWWTMLKLTCYAITYAVYWLVLQVIGALGGTGVSLSLVWAIIIGIQGWQTYDVITLRLANEMLLVGSTGRMGFGQVLPLVMIAQILFAIIDIVSKGRSGWVVG